MTASPLIWEMVHLDTFDNAGVGDERARVAEGHAGEAQHPRAVNNYKDCGLPMGPPPLL